MAYAVKEDICDESHSSLVDKAKFSFVQLTDG